MPVTVEVYKRESLSENKMPVTVTVGVYKRESTERWRTCNSWGILKRDHTEMMHL